VLGGDHNAVSDCKHSGQDGMLRRNRLNSPRKAE
jgi:hypothetical protein